VRDGPGVDVSGEVSLSRGHFRLKKGALIGGTVYNCTRMSVLVARCFKPGGVDYHQIEGRLESCGMKEQWMVAGEDGNGDIYTLWVALTIA
jgi:hypothetical protein